MYQYPDQKTITEVYDKFKELEPDIAPETREAFIGNIEDLARKAGEGLKLRPRQNMFNDPTRFDFFSRYLNETDITKQNYITLMEMAGGSGWKIWMSEYFPFMGDEDWILG